MKADFAPRLDILPPPQRRLWDELAAVPGEFVLYGGTALALHLGSNCLSLDCQVFLAYYRRLSRRIMGCRSPRSSTLRERRRPWCRCAPKQETTSISMRC